MRKDSILKNLELNTSAPKDVILTMHYPSGLKTCSSFKVELPIECFKFEPERITATKAWCNPCLAAYQRRWYRLPKNTERNKRKSKDSHTKLKALIIEQYGGECACCGEKEFCFLSIDHIDGNGASHRKGDASGRGRQIYRFLKNSGFPKDNYQLLCFNCNCAKGFSGQCPHETRRQLNSKDLLNGTNTNI